jgi:hypothetical protein
MPYGFFTKVGPAFRTEDKRMQIEMLLESIRGRSHKETIRVLDGILPIRKQNAPAVAQPMQFKPLEIDGIEWRDGAYHPVSIDEVRCLVREASNAKRKLRVAGSRHSAEPAVFSSNNNDLRVVLDGDDDGELKRLDLLSQDATGALVRIGAGCYMGHNPAEPKSTWANSLDGQLAALGVSLPLTGGITHQTVAGFMQTSSSGGSLKYRFADAVRSIEWVDGQSNIQTFDQGTPEFSAVGVACGLFGVITRVTLWCEPLYFVDGSEINYELADSFLTKNADGHYLLEDALANNEFMHLNWFPQRKVQRVMQWVGQRVNPTLPVKPYNSELKSEWMDLLAAVVLRITNILDHFNPNDELVAALIGQVLRPFVGLDHHEDFHDYWYHALPSDDEVDVENLITIKFTEIWLPVPQLTVALDRLFAAIEREQRMAGNFAVELYGAKESPFWISPSNGRDVVRVDVFWWGHNLGDPREFFTYYWNTLLDIPGARLHWGKFLPTVGQKYGAVTFGPEFIANAYADHIADWLRLRQTFDPHGVFLTDYWRSVFGL